MIFVEERRGRPAFQIPNINFASRCILRKQQNGRFTTDIDVPHPHAFKTSIFVLAHGLVCVVQAYVPHRPVG